MDDFRNFYDSNMNGVILSTEVLQKAFNFYHPQRRLGFTKNRLSMIPSVFVFRKKSMLTPIFNEHILRLHEFGLPEFWKKKYIEQRTQAKKKTQPTTLGFDSVSAAFRICAVLYLISTVVFILEICSVRCPRIKKVLDFLNY